MTSSPRWRRVPLALAPALALALGSPVAHAQEPAPAEPQPAQPAPQPQPQPVQPQPQPQPQPVQPQPQPAPDWATRPPGAPAQPAQPQPQPAQPQAYPTGQVQPQPQPQPQYQPQPQPQPQYQPQPQPQPQRPPPPAGALTGVGAGFTVFSLFALGGAVGLQTLHANHVAGCYRGVFDAGSPLSAIGDCERTGSGYRVGAVGLQLVSIPFGALGGHFLGRGAALRHDKARNMAPIAGPGGGLLGLGVLSLIATRAVFWTDRYKNRCAHEGVEVCARKNQLMLDTTANLSYAAITFGALMLAYAGAYKRERGRRLGTLSPSFGRGYAGLTLQGTF